MDCPTDLTVVLVKYIYRLTEASCLGYEEMHKPGGACIYTAISGKVVGKNVHATIPKGNVEYVQYTVPDTVAVEPTFVSFL